MTQPKPGFFVAHVLTAQRITPHMQRITLTAPEISEVKGLGADQFVRLLLPRVGLHRVFLPVTADWWPELLALPTAERPVLRNYTVRALRPDRAELDIDFVLHGDLGPGTRWAGQATPGAPVGVLAQNRSHAPGPEVTWQLLVGDETALPAIVAILEGIPSGVHVNAFVEVPSYDDIQPLAARPGVQISWLPRYSGQPPGSLAAWAVRRAELPQGPGYAWIAGEAGMTTAIRRHLVRDRGFDKRAITFCGYWRRHKPAYE